MKKIYQIILTLTFFVGINAQTRVVTDMAGRKVTIPTKIERILPHDEKTSIFLFPVAGDKMISRGINREGGSNLKYISKRYSQIPVIDMINVEEILIQNPDIVVVGCFVPEEYSRYERMSSRTQKPFVIIDLNLSRLADSYRFISTLFGDKAKINACVAYLTDFYKEFEKIKKSGVKNNASVYLAVGNNGLQSAPSGSKHVQLFDELNLKNVVQTEIPAKGFAQISIEQIMVWKPDYIFTIDKGGNDPYTEIRSSVLWKSVPAVQNNHVFHIPEDPFNWLGNPPSVNRIPGMIFLSEFFYKNSQESAHRQIRDFYKLFYDYPLTETELVKLLRSK
jgi:iron complex transport system substrate-binding protein